MLLLHDRIVSVAAFLFALAARSVTLSLDGRTEPKDVSPPTRIFARFGRFILRLPLVRALSRSVIDVCRHGDPCPLFGDRIH